MGFPDFLFILSAFSVPAVGAEFTGLQTRSLDQIVQTVEAESGKVKLLTNGFNHLLVILAVWIGVIGQQFIRNLVSFPFLDDPSCDQIQIGGGAGEV